MTDTTEELAHFAMCAQIALALAKQEGKANSSMQEHIFLMKWLNDALKQRRFPQSITIDINYLINHGRKRGIYAKIKGKIEYLYHSCSGDVLNQSDLFRLTYAIEELRDKGWHNYTVTPREWKKGWPPADIPTIYMDKIALNAAFDKKGKQIHPLHLRVDGDPEPVINTFNQYNLPTKTGPEERFCLLIIA